MKGVLYKELLEPREIITAERYSNQLLKVNEKLQDLRPYSGPSARKIILLQDNARPHITSLTKTTIQKICWEVLPHPAYSPDLAPTYYHLFRSLEHIFSGQYIKNCEEVEKCIDRYINFKDEVFFTRGIHMLPGSVWIAMMTFLNNKYVVF